MADSDDVELVIIVAVAGNDVIGNDDDIPWYYPEDLRHFKETTMGHPVIMGRRTYESIVAQLDGPLPDRTNIVLSRGEPDVSAEVIVARSVEDAISEAAETGAARAFIAGGATIYERFLPIADRMVFTEVHEEPGGDTLFPDWERNRWREVTRDDRGVLSLVEYERRDC